MTKSPLTYEHKVIVRHVKWIPVVLMVKYHSVPHTAPSDGAAGGWLAERMREKKGKKCQRERPDY